MSEKEVVDYFKKNDIVAMETETDKNSKSLLKSYVQYHDFVFGSFPSYKQHLGTENSSEEDTRVSYKMSHTIEHVLQISRQCYFVSQEIFVCIVNTC